MLKLTEHGFSRSAGTAGSAPPVTSSSRSDIRYWLRPPLVPQHFLMFAMGKLFWVSWLPGNLLCDSAAHMWALFVFMIFFFQSDVCLRVFMDSHMDYSSTRIRSAP